MNPENCIKPLRFALQSRLSFKNCIKSPLAASNRPKSLISAIILAVLP